MQFILLSFSHVSLAMLVAGIWACMMAILPYCYSWRLLSRGATGWQNAFTFCRSAKKLRKPCKMHPQHAWLNSTKMGISRVDGDLANIQAAQEKIRAQPWWLDWTAGLFPVILVVFLLRSFLFEPFKIPSGSMIPTLMIGDLILVNKFHYGVRLPVINQKITEGTPPARGDVMVFRYPPRPSQDYIKRVVGIPGDEVAYLNKKLTINGKPLE